MYVWSKNTVTKGKEHTEKDLEWSIGGNTAETWKNFKWGRTARKKKQKNTGTNLFINKKVWTTPTDNGYMGTTEHVFYLLYTNSRRLQSSFSRKKIWLRILGDLCLFTCKKFSMCSVYIVKLSVLFYLCSWCYIPGIW